MHPPPHPLVLSWLWMWCRLSLWCQSWVKQVYALGHIAQKQVFKVLCVKWKQNVFRGTSGADNVCLPKGPLALTGLPWKCCVGPPLNSKSPELMGGKGGGNWAWNSLIWRNAIIRLTPSQILQPLSLVTHLYMFLAVVTSSQWLIWILIFKAYSRSSL